MDFVIDFGSQGPGKNSGAAIEAAQPLAAFADQVLQHITLAGSVGPAKAMKSRKKRSASTPNEEPQRICFEAIEIE